MEKLIPLAHIFKKAKHPRTLKLKKGGFTMALLWITTIGFLLCLGFVVGTWIHFLRSGLDSGDSKRIDPINNDDDNP